MFAHNYSLNAASGFGSSLDSLNKWPAISLRHWTSIPRTGISRSVASEYLVCSISSRTIPCSFTPSTQRLKTQKPTAIPFMTLQFGLKQWKAKGEDFFPSSDTWGKFSRVHVTPQTSSHLPGLQPQTWHPQGSYLPWTRAHLPGQCIPPYLCVKKTKRWDFGLGSKNPALTGPL